MHRCVCKPDNRDLQVSTFVCVCLCLFESCRCVCVCVCMCMCAGVSERKILSVRSVFFIVLISDGSMLACVVSCFL